MDDNERIRKLWLVAVITTLVVLVVAIITPLDAEANPATRRVDEAIYGNRPLGLPWLAVHAMACIIVVIPLPLCIVSTVKLWSAGKALGVSPGWDPFSLTYKCYRATSGIPELHGIHFRVQLTWGWFLAVFIGWIVLTTIKGV